MSISKIRRIVLAAAAAVLAAGSAARADIRDYEFQLVDQAVEAGPDKIIAVRLINKATGKPVPDAVIFATRLDMAPDGMQEMATKIAPVPGGELLDVWTFGDPYTDVATGRLHGGAFLCTSIRSPKVAKASATSASSVRAEWTTY